MKKPRDLFGCHPLCQINNSILFDAQNSQAYIESFNSEEKRQDLQIEPEKEPPYT